MYKSATQRFSYSTPSQSARIPSIYKAHSRKVALAYAQQLTAAQAAAAAARPDGEDVKGKPVISVQVTRPSLPLERPLPLANVLEVQRLLFLLEAPEYCMRAFREHGVNGQDLLHMQEDDLDDSRFKFPKHVQRKVLRVPVAWRTFQAIAGWPTHTNVTLEQYLAHYSVDRSPEALSLLQASFRALDVNNNGNITFEEFLVGFSLLEAAVEQTRPTQPSTTTAIPDLTTAPSTTTDPTLGSTSASNAATATPCTSTRNAANGSFVNSLACWFQL